MSRQDVCRQSAICQADKIWTGSRTCYVGCCSWHHSSTEKDDISFSTKDVISSVSLLQICRLLRGLVKRYKSSSMYQCQYLLSCEELSCLLHTPQVAWGLGDVSVSKGNANAPTYAYQSWWQKSCQAYWNAKVEIVNFMGNFQGSLSLLQENLATQKRMNVQR